MNRLNRSYKKTFEESQWYSPLTTMSKHTSPREWFKRLVAIIAGWEGGMIDNNRNRETARWMPSAHIAGRLTTTLPTVGHITRTKMAFKNSIEIHDHPIRTILQPTTNQCSGIPVGRSPLTRRLINWRDRIQSTSCTNIATRFGKSWMVFGIFGRSRLNNRQDCRITEISEIPIWLPNGSMITLHHVRHVPNLKRNLISIG